MDNTFKSRTDFYLVSVFPKMAPNFCYVDLYEFIDKKLYFSTTTFETGLFTLQFQL